MFMLKKLLSQLVCSDLRILFANKFVGLKVDVAHVFAFCMYATSEKRNIHPYLKQLKKEQCKFFFFQGLIIISFPKD